MVQRPHTGKGDKIGEKEEILLFWLGGTTSLMVGRENI